MLFNSLEFLLFLPTVIIVYFLIAHKFRWLWLLAVSYFFYMSWNPKYALLILFSSITTYYSGILIEKANYSNLDSKLKKKRKNLYVFLSFSINLSILIFFKYYNFIGENINNLFSYFGDDKVVPIIDLLLPVGISFYTFQALSYTIDVYRGDIKAQHHFGKYALFVSFFPQLVAGPIERSSHLIPQFDKKMKFSYKNLYSGGFIILSGFFKKIVIADRLSVLVNEVYNSPESHNGYTLLTATIFFAFQIYCDFSAYSDIAIGSAKIMGYDLMKNFDRPYFSKSISEFWRRWHISLSTWFRDYLYFPLGGNRVSKTKFFRNIMIVFLVSGVWHGAEWSFIIWGGLHGMYIIIENVTQPYINNKLKKYKLLSTGYTFLLVSIAWVFFRANSFSDAIYIIKEFFKINSIEITSKKLVDFNLTLAYMAIVILIIAQILQRKVNLKNYVQKMPLIFRWSFLIVSILIIIFWGYYPMKAAEFIYFQF